MVPIDFHSICFHSLEVSVDQQQFGHPHSSKYEENDDRILIFG